MCVDRVSDGIPTQMSMRGCLRLLLDSAGSQSSISSAALPPNKGLVSKINLMVGALYSPHPRWNGSLCSVNKRDSYLKVTLAPALWATNGNHIKGGKW